MGKSKATPGGKLAKCLVQAVLALLGLPPCMPTHMPYLPNNIIYCITPQMVALAGNILR